MTLENGWMGRATRPLVTTELLGQAAVPRVRFEEPDGKPLRIDTDYLGQQREATNPTPGPFEQPGTGRCALKVW
jgi:hypothetical protein